MDLGRMDLDLPDFDGIGDLDFSLDGFDVLGEGAKRPKSLRGENLWRITAEAAAEAAAE